MEESPQSKWIKVVSGPAMLNFVYWVVAHYPNLRDLRSLPRTTLLQLIYKFEQSRPDLEPRSSDAWLEAIEALYRGEDVYREAREVLMKKR
jgi:hypothetical protein